MSFLVDLQTERLFLKSLAESDLPDFHTIWTEPGATHWSFNGASKSLEASRTFMHAKALQTDAASSTRSYIAYLRSDADRTNPLGIVSLYPWFRDGPFEPLLVMANGARKESTWEVAYMYQTQAWGKGYATEALKAVLARLGEERAGKMGQGQGQGREEGKNGEEEGGDGEETVVVAITNTDNPGTLRVMEKGGFECHGKLVLGDGKIWIGGAWRDELVLVWSRRVGFEQK